MKLRHFNLLIILAFFITFTGLKSENTDYVKKSKDVVFELKDMKFDEVYSQFDSVVKKMLTRQKLEATWKSFVSSVGEFKEILGDTSFMLQSYPCVRLTVKFEKMDFHFIFAFNTLNQINTFRIMQVQQPYTYQNPPYAKTDKYNEVSSAFVSDSLNITGTLTIPNGEGKFPVVILVHGSGPNDRDETIGPNKPFKDLASGLATMGIAVYRYDKRTKLYPEKFINNGNYTLKEETINDAVNAFKFIKTQKNIDPNRIFVLGHSLGAMAAPMIAEITPGLDGIIIMAAPTRKLEDIIYDQIKYISLVDGKIDSLEQEQLDSLLIQIQRVKALKENSDVPSSLLPMNAPAGYWYYLNKYNQTATAAKLKLPVLILQGERDYQVTMEDFNVWKNNFGNYKNFTLKSYPKLYHLFIEGEGKSTPQEYTKEGHVAEYVIKDIADWIKAH